MSNGDAERPHEDDAPLEADAPTGLSKARAVKTKTTKKRTAKTAVAKTPASKAVAKTTTAKRSTRTISGYRRVRLGHGDMFVAREVADALIDKDLKRLRAIFKRTLKRARKRDTKKKR
ncbi:MAG: hypothetical protein JJE40_06195 [Vicinamibacteria bacterium]|nr:hypothetical protein [Vicinamibacteria bacterium]